MLYASRVANHCHGVFQSSLTLLSVPTSPDRDVHDRLAKRLTPPVKLDAYTRAHLLDVKALIEKALDAEYPAEAR